MDRVDRVDRGDQSVRGPGNWTLATGGGGGPCEDCVYVFTASNVFISLYITHSLWPDCIILV